MANATDTHHGPWVPPTRDQEFVFKDVASLPAWADKGWASMSGDSPALAVPAGDVYGGAPYTTKLARVGDTVKFVAGKGSRTPHFEVIAGDPADADEMTPKIWQESAASLQDRLKNGSLKPGDLSTIDKAQVLSQSPELRALVDPDSIGKTASPTPTSTPATPRK
jgi:hypothetical protein